MPQFFDALRCDLDASALAMRREFVDREGARRHRFGLSKAGSKVGYSTLAVERRHVRRRSFRECRNQVRGFRYQCAHYIVREVKRVHASDSAARGFRGLLRRRRGVKKKKFDKAPVVKMLSKQRVPISYINKRSLEHKASHGRVSRTEYNRLVQQWVAEYTSMEPDERCLVPMPPPEAAIVPFAPSSSSSDAVGHPRVVVVLTYSLIAL